MYHYHKCLVCNCEWRHFRDELVSNEVYKENHTCTGCGRGIRKIHRYQDEHESPAYRVRQYMFDIYLLCIEVQEGIFGEETIVAIAEKIAEELALSRKISLDKALRMITRRLVYVNSI